MGPTSPPQKPLVGTPLASARSPYLGTPMGLAQYPPPHIGGPLWGSRLPGPEPPIFRDAPPLHGAHPVHPEECLLRPPPGLTLAPLFPVPAASPPPTLPLSIPPLPAASSPGSESPLPGPPGCCTARAPPPQPWGLWVLGSCIVGCGGTWARGGWWWGMGTLHLRASVSPLALLAPCPAALHPPNPPPRGCMEGGRASLPFFGGGHSTTCLALGAGEGVGHRGAEAWQTHSFSSHPPSPGTSPCTPPP